MGRDTSNPSDKDIDSILRLLKGFQNRNRVVVVDIILTYWSGLAGRDYDSAVEALTGYSVPQCHWARAVDILNRDLGGPHDSAARRGLVRLLR